MPWKKNYFVFTWNPGLPSQTPSRSGGTNQEQEVNFQLSLRSLVWQASQDFSFHVGYTGKSSWQIAEKSAPFRTTDHSLEGFAETRLFRNLLQYRVSALHQSNGESGLFSRSWNRIYGEVLWYQDEKDYRTPSFFADDIGYTEGDSALRRVSLKVWHKFAIDESNNGDISEYLGHFELTSDWYLGTKNKIWLSAMLRNNLGTSAPNRTTIQLEASGALGEASRWFAQFFSGYGLSLLEYRRSQHNYSIGFELSS